MAGSAKRTIPVAVPALVGNEKKYLADCIESTWISALGPYIDRFERSFAEFCGVTHAVSCCSGTAALHLALLALGVGRDDEVLVPTLTFVASANAVTYCGARPVFLDSEPETWNLDPNKIEEKITPRTKGIIVVHLYGHPVDMDPVWTVARKHGIFVLEDAAEAHGAEYRGRRVGSLGDAATFSFYANKILTTGEGGAVVTNDASLARKVRQLKGQGMDLQRRYWFPEIGYNYRMGNLAAAMGLGQLERADWHIQRHREVASWYAERLGRTPGLVLPVEKPWARNVYWMYSVILDDPTAVARDDVIAYMADRGVETRPVFYPLHTLPPYVGLAGSQPFPVAERLAAHGVTLPTSANLEKDDVAFVCETLLAAISGSQARHG